MAAAEQSPEYRELMRSTEQWAVYQPYVNPAAAYLRGVILLNPINPADGPNDAEQARKSFERVAGTVRGNTFIKEDIRLAQAAAIGKKAAPHVWVMFENGQSPTFEQLNFAVPMPVAARQGGVTVRPVTVSLPRLAPQPPAYPALDVAAGSARAVTQSIGDLQAVMGSEYRQRLPGHLSAAVFEAVAKAAGISAVNALAGKKSGAAGLLLDVAATAAANVTSSDTRSWYSLPRDFQAARVPVPADGRLSIGARGGSGQTVAVPTDGSSIVYVKAQTPGSPLVVQVFRL